MQKFRFRLEALLKYRRMQKEQAQLSFSRASQVFNDEKDKLINLSKILNEGLKTFRDNQTKALTVEELKNYNNYLDKVKENIKDQRGRVNTAEKAMQDCLQILQQAAKNCEIVEKLKNQRLHQYMVEALIEEQGFLDELGLQNYVRKN